MDDIYYEKVLNRIIQGRLRLRLGDLVLFIHEPNKDVVEESFDIYDDYYKTAYFDGVYSGDEIVELLIENDLWSPVDDKNLEKKGEQLDELKIQAFQNFYSSKKLAGIKRQIRHLEEQMGKISWKKKQLDHVSCDGVANFARRSWIIERTTKLADGSPYTFDSVNISSVMDFYSDNQVSSGTFRKIARSQPFRAMWQSSKKRGNVFDRPPCDLDNNQLALCSFSIMYDSVYESPDAPDEKAIEDDDCLDGWFIVQKRKYEKDRKKREVDDMIKNEKIKNSDEIFLMASDQEQAQEIYGLNDDISRSVVRNRSQQIRDADGERVMIQDLHDVKLQNQMNRVQATKAKMGSMTRSR